MLDNVSQSNRKIATGPTGPDLPGDQWRTVPASSNTEPLTLTADVLPEAERHLSLSGQIMASLISSFGPCDLVYREFRPFSSLVTSIISQQLSYKAADTIKQRVLKITPTLSPSEILSAPEEAFREAGLSRAKIKYIIALASQVEDGRLNFEALIPLPEKDIIDRLTQLPGIGNWTAEMFLIFGLKRADVLAVGDAGLQRAVRLLYGESVDLPNIGESWRPYRSIASWYLWKYLSSNNALMPRVRTQTREI